MVERQIVDLVVVGSNPITHPFTFMLNEQTFINQSVLGMTKNAPVAQLDRATDFESVGRTFEPCRAHLKIFSAAPAHFVFFFSRRSCNHCVSHWSVIKKFFLHFEFFIHFFD